MIDRVLRILLIALSLLPAAAQGQTDPAAATQTLVIGHRGVPGFGAENTIASFERAIELGADGIELDLILTKDGRLAVIHDWTLNRLIGEEQLDAVYPDRWTLVDDERVWLTRDFTMEELGRLTVQQRGPRSNESGWGDADTRLRVPSYREALAAFQRLRAKSPGIKLYTEIKTSAEHLSPAQIDRCADVLIDALRSADELDRPRSHWVQSFDARLMDRLASRSELDDFDLAMLLSCEPGLTTSANPLVLTLDTINSETDLHRFLADEVVRREMSIVHGWKLMWWNLFEERGIDCLSVAHGLGLEIHAFTFRDHRFRSDYENRPELVPNGAAFESTDDELRWFMAAGFDAIMSDTVDSAVGARLELDDAAP